MSAATITLGSLCDTWNEMRPLTEAHYREIATHQDIPLDPLLDLYDALEKAGKLRVFLVRDAASVLIGYAIYTVAPNPHYRSMLQASQDVLFLREDMRKGGLGARLVRHCDDVLRAEGIILVTQHVKVSHPVLGLLLERQGYQCVERIYSKRLDTPKE